MEQHVQEVLDLYEGSAIHDERGEYVFINNGLVIKMISEGIMVQSSTKSLMFGGLYLSPYQIDQFHPEIIKIRKRLEFLNKL